MRRCVYPRRGRGLTEGVTACAVGAGAHIDGASRCPMRPPLSLRADGVTRCNAPLAHTDGWRTMWMCNPMDGGRCGCAIRWMADDGVRQPPKDGCINYLQTEGCVDIYNRSSAVDVNGLMSRGRRANPVLTCETALRRFFPDCAVDAIRWMAVDALFCVFWKE